MNIIEAIILGLVQGLTEFIPISSSGHLLWLHNAFGLTDNGLSFDVALHIGTLLALVTFFYYDILELAKAIFKKGPKTSLAWIVVVATIPAIIAGVLLQDLAETSFRNPYLVCVTMALMALVMLAAERAGRRAPTKLENANYKQGLFIGLAQTIALIPGVSRSGSTISAGLFAGLDRVAATRFSFLLSIPITAGAVAKVIAEQATISQIRAETGLFAVGIITAFVSGYISIRFLLKFVAKHSLNAFAYYRLAVAAVVLVLLSIY